MIKFLLCCAVMMLVVSCGNSGGGSGSHSPNNRIQNEQLPEESSLYSQVSLVAAGFTGEYQHEIKINIGQEVDVEASFQSDIDNKQCSVNLTLTGAEATKLKGLSDKLKICIYQTDSDIQIETDTNGIGLIKPDGQGEYANKELSGQNGEAYLCQGKEGFYQMIRNSLSKEISSNSDCPANSLSAFFIKP